MHVTRLSDLNELALTVRDDISRAYIMESVVSYQTGNYRAAILSAWIAVTYDIISKLRELAAGNDSPDCPDVGYFGPVVLLLARGDLQRRGVLACGSNCRTEHGEQVAGVSERLDLFDQPADAAPRRAHLVSVGIQVSPCRGELILCLV